jgi:hypothetical protein
MVEFVTILVILIFTALPARSADQPLATARAPHDAIDARRPLPLLPVMAVHQKQTMREHLGAVQEIIAALGSDDFDAVQRSATRLGFSEEVGQMCEHLGAASPAFTKQALAFHHTADRIATAARDHDRSRVLVELSTTLQACTACHAAWKQDVVSESTWNNLALLARFGGRPRE